MRVSCRTEGAVWRVRMEPGSGETVLIDAEGVRALASILDDCAESGEGPKGASCRVLLLEGTATSFCEGLDVQSVLGLGRSEMQHAVRCFANCLRGLRETRALVVAAVEGKVAGGGVGIAAAADLVLATRQASFVLPELTLGLLPAVVLPLILERLPRQKVRLLAISEGVEAAQAHALGLVDRLVEDSDALQRALRSSIKHALRLDPAAVGELKRLTTELSALPLGMAVERGVERTAALLADPERGASLRAFLEGEPPPWFDRWKP
jgi:enoyl-CoA hydratase/carnithine racemase